MDQKTMRLVICGAVVLTEAAIAIIYYKFCKKITQEN